MLRIPIVFLLGIVLLSPVCTAQESTSGVTASVALPDSVLADWGSARVERREGLRIVRVPTVGGERLDLSVTVYANTSRDADRYPYTILVGDGYTNQASATDDAAFTAEYVARQIGVDPVRFAFVFRLGLHRQTGRDLFVRATFRRGASGNLVAPSWRVLTLDEARAYTEGHDWSRAMDKGEWIEADQCLLPE